MNLQYKIGLGLAALLLAFTIGRYTAKQTTVTTKSTTDVVTHVDDNKDTHKVEVITKQPTGAVTDTITTDTVDTSHVNIVSQTRTDTVSKAASLPKTNFSALFGTDLSRGSSAIIPLYGVSIQRELIGPITIGGFGLTSGVIGVSVGINF